MSRDDHDATTGIAPFMARSAIVAVRFRIDVVAGPDAGASIEIDPSRAGRVMIGKSAACDVSLHDARVSRRHAALEVDGEWLKLTDLGSTNHTFVNDVVVKEAFLRGGEMIRLGETVLTVRSLEARALELSHDMRFGRVLGGSTAMRRLYPLCARLAGADVSVVIEGETGTGKELLAEALHEGGPRAGRPFIVFDCTAVAPSLVESALFGHERGAFTNAVSRRRGGFELAHGGTLLIDEIGDLELSLQPKLLRVLERGELQRVGGESVVKCDVRVISATRRDLEREVQAGRFREDLFFRLAVARLELPALRDRQGDIGLLARHFWRALGGVDRPIPPELVARFEDYAWPGNVRELRNAVARHLALGDLADSTPGVTGAVGDRPSGVSMPPSSMPSMPSSPASSPLSSTGESSSMVPPADSLETDIIGDTLARDLPLPIARRYVVEEFERRYVERVLARHDGNVTRAAAASGIARRHFYTIRGKTTK